jgi:hypothetical protein
MEPLCREYLEDANGINKIASIEENCSYRSVSDGKFKDQ